MMQEGLAVDLIQGDDDLAVAGALECVVEGWGGEGGTDTVGVVEFTVYDGVDG